MKNAKNALVWVAVGLTALVELSHFGWLTLGSGYMLISMILFIAGILVALIVDCKIGAIIYAVGVAVDILIPVIAGVAAAPDAVGAYIGYALGASAFQIISLVLLFAGIPVQKRMRRPANTHV